MRPTQNLLPQKTLSPVKKAAVPIQGTAAFFCSTGTLSLYGVWWNFTISHQWSQAGENIVLYNLLMEKHYFRLNRAETPIAVVVFTEEQKHKSSMFREVAA